MADHVHKQLRDAVATALTGLATTADRVYASRVYPLTEATESALKVYVQSDDAERVELEADTLLDTVELRVEVAVKKIDTFDDLVDQIKKEVMAALAAGVTVDSINVDLAYQGSDTEYGDEAEKPHASCVMRFEAVLYFISGTPDQLEQT